MIDLQSMYRAVCRIEYRDATGIVKGQGAFIAPNRVLTAWHVVQAMKTPVFINSDGARTGLKKGGRHMRKKECDIAVVELDDPIGHETLLLPTDMPQLTNPEGKGFLVTRFNNVASRYKVSLLPKLKKVDLFFKDTNDVETQLDLFDCDIQLRPGYSGSPIIDRYGRVFSVVSAIAQDPSEIKKYFKKAGIVREHDYFFMGTRPQDLAEISRDRLQVLPR